MRTEQNADGSTSYILSETEKFVILVISSYLVGRGTGYRKGRLHMAKEINKTGSPKP